MGDCARALGQFVDGAGFVGPGVKAALGGDKRRSHIVVSGISLRNVILCALVKCVNPHWPKMA